MSDNVIYLQDRFKNKKIVKQDSELDERINRIKNSINRINQLMSELRSFDKPSK